MLALYQTQRIQQPDNPAQPIIINKKTGTILTGRHPPFLKHFTAAEKPPIDLLCPLNVVLPMDALRSTQRTAGVWVIYRLF
jgi:hypothetical protein